MLLIAAWTGPWNGKAPTFEDRSIVALAFMGSCAAGIVLSMGHRKLHSIGGKARWNEVKGEGDRGWVGHHPDCGRFEDHVIAINRKRYCAGCLGLAIGSSVSIAVMSIYLLVPPVDILVGRWLVALGLFMVVVCTAAVAWHPSAPCLHVLFNAILVMGFLVVTIGVTSAGADVMLGLFAILICWLWLDARIQFSHWQHERACELCGRSCRAY